MKVKRVVTDSLVEGGFEDDGWHRIMIWTLPGERDLRSAVGDGVSKVRRVSEEDVDKDPSSFTGMEFLSEKLRKELKL